jgi:hypothetical protein
MFLESKVRREFVADNLTAICGRLSRQCGILNISQPYRPPRPVMATALLFFNVRITVCVHGFLEYQTTGKSNAQ